MADLRKDRERRQKAREERRQREIDVEQGTPLANNEGVFGSLKKVVGMQPTAATPPPPPPEPTWRDSFRNAVGWEKPPPPPPKQSWDDSIRGAIGWERPPPSTVDTMKGYVGLKPSDPTIWDEVS